jgi:ribonuclease R
MTLNNKKSKKKKPSAPSTKEMRLFDNLLKVTQQFMNGKSYVAMSEAELFERLKLPELHRDLLARILMHMHQEGLVTIERNRYALKASTQQIVTGVIKVHPRGFGFVQPNDKNLFKEDIFIPKPLIMNAVDGDSVEVLVDPSTFTEKGPEGKVVTILSRGRTHLAGVIKNITHYGEINVIVPILGFSQKVVLEPTEEMVLKEGDRIVMEVVDWGDKETVTVCRFSHYIGHISDPSCDIKAAIEEFEIRSDFSQKTIQEAEAMGNRVSQADLNNREDFRELECFTIDPDTAKDFDDAISLSKDEKGFYHLGVHIADVSHYVRPGTALDQEAIARCNSTYFPGTCIPMLPSVLSDNLCSLKPKVNRLTMSVLVSFDQEGNQTNYRITRSVIKSQKRFTYKEAKEVLDGKKASKHLPTLNLMVELCGLLKKKRFERGSIEFALPELVILVDDKGVPTGTDYISYDITHQLVEEYMLKANEIVAQHLAKQGKDLTYRIHDIPAEEGMKEFAMLARAFGFNISEKPTNREIQQLFEEAMSSSYGPYLATSYIRRMKLAIYSPDNIGHFGLGLSHYCHFTSPIRRYVDLVTHRSLFSDALSYKSLEEIANNCSEKERISARAEQNVKQLKKLRLLDAQHKADPNRQYEAVVTKVKNYGVVFEILDLMLESYFHVSELDGDYYIYDEETASLRGRHTHKRFLAGDKILVMLKKVDFILLESTWDLIPDNEEPQRQSRAKFSRGKERSARRKDNNYSRPLKEKESSSKTTTANGKPLPGRDKPLAFARSKDFIIAQSKSKNRKENKPTHSKHKKNTSKGGKKGK